MRPPEILQTNRLCLRRALVEDAAAIFRTYARDPEVTKYLAWKPTGKVEDTRSHLRSSILAWEEGRAFQWVILQKKGRRLLGAVGARVDGHKLELGYVLAKKFWGKGYMTEAVKAIVAWALTEKDVYRVWAVCDIDNPASARVMEKAGLKREGLLRRWSVHPTISDEPRDCYCYAITK
jgi:ribosomal-protein-alanine N-acetyltransferase